MSIGAIYLLHVAYLIVMPFVTSRFPSRKDRPKNVFLDFVENVLSVVWLWCLGVVLVGCLALALSGKAHSGGGSEPTNYRMVR